MQWFFISNVVNLQHLSWSTRCSNKWSYWISLCQLQSCFCLFRKSYQVLCKALTVLAVFSNLVQKCSVAEHCYRKKQHEVNEKIMSMMKQKSYKVWFDLFRFHMGNIRLATRYKSNLHLDPKASAAHWLIKCTLYLFQITVFSLLFA